MGVGHWAWLILTYGVLLFDSLTGVEMSVYAIAQLKITDRATYDRYQAKFMGVMKHFQGRVLATDEKPQVIEGEWERDKVVLLSFPNEKAGVDRVAGVSGDFKRSQGRFRGGGAAGEGNRQVDSRILMSNGSESQPRMKRILQSRSVSRADPSGPIWLLKKAQPNLRTSRDGNSQWGHFDRKGSGNFEVCLLKFAGHESILVDLFAQYSL
jgi:uncharacterized protein (DUF1330 family)